MTVAQAVKAGAPVIVCVMANKNDVALKTIRLPCGCEETVDLLVNPRTVVSCGSCRGVRR